MNCRFVVLGNSVAYTTANEIGAFLMSRGIKFEPMGNDSNSYHFGKVFNTRLISGLKKAIKCGNVVDYTAKDFPKLVYNQSNNNEMILYLIQNNLCSVTSTANVQRGSSEKALDLYTLNAAVSIFNSYDINIVESDIEILSRTFLYKPTLKISDRAINEICVTDNKQKRTLFSI
jgi:hypothetical protein